MKEKNGVKSRKREHSKAVKKQGKEKEDEEKKKKMTKRRDIINGR
jgi:hypothetical protein